MRQAFLVSLFLSAATAYGQVAASRKPINLDSLIAVQNERKAALTGKPYPEFFALAGNKEISNISLKGKVVFINFWFASCAPCIAEMEDLNKLYDKFKQDKNFEFVSFTFENAEKIESIKKKYNIQYAIYSIPQEECYRLNLQGGFPTTIILDTAGNIKYVSLLGQAISFKTIFYPIIAKELGSTL